MKYYEMHEQVYSDLSSKGLKSWDKAVNLEEMLAHGINNELESSFKRHIELLKGKSALDLGTGSGTVALFLAKQGLNVTGLDVSATAIDMAKKNAEELGLNCRFEVNDITEYHEEMSYDLVVDSSFLHCIVGKDRERALNSIRKVLRPSGLLFVHTMVRSKDMSQMLEAPHLFLEDEVLYSTGPEEWPMDWKDLNGKKVFAHRQLLSSKGLEKELESCGLEVFDSKIKENPGHPDLYIGWARGVS